MLATLRSRRWVGALALASLFAVAAVLLGNWQFSKHQEKAHRRDVVEANYDATPRPLRQVLSSPGEALGPDQEWTRVRASGQYLSADQLLVRNRPYRGVFGYEVLVPLQLDVTSGSGEAVPERALLTVDRGWVENAEDAATLPEVPPPPSGSVEVTGWLRSGEEDLGRDLPEGQVASINLAEVEQATGARTYGAYLLLDTETPAPAERPARADRPDVSTGVHFAYALQWWLTAPVGLILVLVMARREYRESLTEGAPSRQAPRRVRIWDEEDA